MQHECRITVLETKCFPELQEKYLADPRSGPCPFFKPGDTFLLKRTPQQDDFYHLMDGKFCGEAWDAVSRYVYTALQGGSIMKGWTILSHVASPKMMAELDEGLDKLIQKNGLGQLSSDELCSTLVVLGPDGNEYTGNTLMDKIIDANIPPQEQPPEAGIQEKDILKAQDGAAVEMKEEQQQPDQQILP